ncbi:MAG: hypothetical protein RI988_717 [Pseudomonadota bacterium]|jgi:hypothetical protein
MARIRTLKPEVWMSPQVMNLSAHARLLFIGLITQSDDEGRGSADARRLKAAIFGGDDCTSTDVRRWLDEVSLQRLAVLYQTENDGLLFQLPSWKAHQSIDRPKPSHYPAPPDPKPPSLNDRRTIVEPAPKDREGSEGKGTEGREGIGPDARAHTREAVPIRVDELVAAEVSREAIEEWRQHRDALGKPLRPHELIVFGKVLRGAGSPSQQLATVRNCIANGWANLRHADTQATAPVLQTWEPPDDEPEEQRRA